MTESYPVILNGELTITSCGGDVSLVCNLSSCRYYFWIGPKRAADVSDLIVGNTLRLSILGGSFSIKSWVEGVPYIHAVTILDPNEYVKSLVSRVKDVIENKEIVFGFSGGKDSIAALYVLSKLREYIDFKLRVIYVHIPYLESIRNIKFVEDVGRILNIDIEIIEISKRIMKKNLKWFGMPRRGFRWCTYLKVKPIRKLVRGHENVIEALADRVFESLKRAWRLLNRIESDLVASKKRFLPVQSFTILDIIYLNRILGLKHPAYDEGLPRVSCDLCPFKVLYELGSNYIDKSDDPGIIELGIRRSWRRLGNSKLRFDDYVRYALWRFSPREATLVNRVRYYLRSIEGINYVSDFFFRNLIRASWDDVYELRKSAKYVTNNELVELIRYSINSGFKVLIP